MDDLTISPEDLDVIRADAAAGRPNDIRWTNYTMQLVLAELDQRGELLAEREDAAVERMADKLLGEMRLRSAGVRDGSWEMDLGEAREMAALYVGMCRPLLGDAENYTETPVGPFPKENINFTVKIAESPEDWYIITVQRKWGMSPHEARRKAEDERDQLAERVTACRSEIKDLYAQLAEASEQTAQLTPEFAFRWTEYSIEETSLAYDSEDDAREAAKPHHRGAPIITRLVTDWRPVDTSEEA